MNGHADVQRWGRFKSNDSQINSISLVNHLVTDDL